MEKAKKVVVNIAPLVRIPLGKRPFFSYLWEKELPAGTLVSIPFHGKNIEGIVVGKSSDQKIDRGVKLKNINSVLAENFLNEKQVLLAEFLSDYYISPLGTILKNFVPRRVKTRNVERETPARNDVATSGRHNVKLKKNIILTKEQNLAIKKITAKPISYKLEARSCLLFGPSGSGKTEVYIHSIAELKTQNPKRQFLILLPELTLTPQAIERYGEHFPSEEIVVLNSRISKGQLFANWEKIRTGQAKIVIGSRMAVFAPFKKLGLIVIDEEQDMSFKQWDMNPRYDARLAAEKLAKLHQCPIVFGSATPRVETYYKTRNNKIKFLELPFLNLKAISYKLEATLVDMKKERWSKNYSCISKKLKSEIAYALKNNLQTILFINRQGMSSFSVCEQCKTVLKCPQCDRALVYDESGNYRCLHCPYKTSIIPECPKCHGLVFKNVGLGTQKVEREIKNIFSGAKILRADSQSLRGAKSPEKIYEEFSEGEADILIGTQVISKGWDLPNVALIGIIDADNMLTIPDFLANEKAFETIVQVAGRTNRPGARFPGQVLIQTFNPENKILKLAAQKDFLSFYNQEIAEREALKLPPFSRIIKLVFQSYKFSEAEKETEKLFNFLQNKISEIKTGITLSPPQDSFVSKVRGRFRKQLLIKISDEKSFEKIKTYLENLPAGWIIDTDPISII